MIDQVNGRELPPLEDWTPALIEEAIKCKVQFGVLVLGQGMVTGQLVSAVPKARMALVRITYDPRDRLVGVEYPAEMRYVSEIRHPANNFSLMRTSRKIASSAAAREAAKRLIAQAKTEIQQPASQKTPTASSTAARSAAVKARSVQTRSATQAVQKPLERSAAQTDAVNFRRSANGAVASKPTGASFTGTRRTGAQSTAGAAIKATDLAKAGKSAASSQAARSASASAKTTGASASAAKANASQAQAAAGARPRRSPPRRILRVGS